MALGLLGGVEIGAVPAVVAPDAQQEVRPGRGAERRRTRMSPSKPLPSHIPDAMQPDLSPEDCAAIAALLRDTIAADRFPMSPRIKRMAGHPQQARSAGPEAGAVPAAEAAGRAEHADGEEGVAALRLARRRCRRGDSPVLDSPCACRADGAARAP